MRASGALRRREVPGALPPLLPSRKLHEPIARGQRRTRPRAPPARRVRALSARRSFARASAGRRHIARGLGRSPLLPPAPAASGSKPARARAAPPVALFSRASLRVQRPNPRGTQKKPLPSHRALSHRLLPPVSRPVGWIHRPSRTSFSAPAAAESACGPSGPPRRQTGAARAKQHPPRQDRPQLSRPVEPIRAPPRPLDRIRPRSTRDRTAL